MNTEYKEGALGESWQSSFNLIWYNYCSSRLNTSWLPCTVMKEQGEQVREQQGSAVDSGECAAWCLSSMNIVVQCDNDDSALSGFVYSHCFSTWGRF